jgi:hypothetical protein
MWSSVCGGARRRICMLTRAHRPGLGSARDPFQGCTTSRLMSSKTVPVNFVYAGEEFPSHVVFQLSHRTTTFL